jgi:NMD protein affecting ribosome stability and mRNA decay
VTGVCVECGNDDVTQGHDVCMDCLEATDAPTPQGVPPTTPNRVLT